MSPHVINLHAYSSVSNYVQTRLYMNITPNSISLKLLVLRCSDLQASKLFYEELGMLFVEEQHGKGPKHYSSELSGMILELYPLTKDQKPDHIRLGFASTSIKAKTVLLDPDDRKVELTPLAR